MTPSRRVTWQATSDGGNCLPHSAVRRLRGRSWRGRSKASACGGSGSADDPEGQARVTALKQGLQNLGWTDGRNIQIETRFGGADAGRIRDQAAELVALAPDVLVGQTTPVVRALRQATSSIPIVVAAINDPV